MGVFLLVLLRLWVRKLLQTASFLAVLLVRVDAQMVATGANTECSIHSGSDVIGNCLHYETAGGLKYKYMQLSIASLYVQFGNDISAALH